MNENKVVACIDGSSAALGVCDYAAWASQRLSAPLLMLHVLDHEQAKTATNLSGNIGIDSRKNLLAELADLDQKRGKLLMEQGHLLLGAAVERAKASGVTDPQQLQRHGTLPEVVRYLEDDVRLLVAGRQGEHGDSEGAPVGSQLESVIRTMQRPILVTAGEFHDPQRIMLAFDNGPSTRKGVEMVADSPLFQGLPIHLVMIGPETDDARTAINAAKDRLQQAGHEVVVAIRSGDVEQGLLDYADQQDIDMLIMGAYGHSRIRQFFVGSTTTRMLELTRRPLLLLR